MSPLTPDREARPVMGRPARSSREEVVAAGLDILKSDGLAAVTLTAVGERLGLHKVGLYTYVKNKDDLLIAMRDEVDRRNLEAIRAVEGLDPHDALTQVCRALAGTSADFGALQLAVEPNLTGIAMESGERFLAILADLGLDSTAQLRVYLLLVSFIQTYVARARELRSPTPDESAQLLAAVNKNDSMPHTRAMLAGPAAPLAAPQQLVIDDMLTFIIDVVIPAARNS